MSDENIHWKALQWAWDNWDKVQERLNKLSKWFRGSKKAAGILILGAGGTGKTTLAKLLAGESGFGLDSIRKYQESIEVEHYSLADDPQVEVVVPPGQRHRRDTTWSDLQADIVSGRFRGVALVSAYGHHSLGDYKRHSLYKGNKTVFLKNYLRDRRAEEIAILNRMATHLSTCQKRIWLLSAVTKQDLWWKERARVDKHYFSNAPGSFGYEVDQLRAMKPAQGSRVESVACSLAINNFVSGKNELLKETTQGYDQQMQLQSLQRLFEVVAGLMNWEINQ